MPRFKFEISYFSGMRINSILVLLFLFNFNSCKKNQEDLSSFDIHLIPKPHQMELGKGNFTINELTTLYCDSGFEIASHFLKEYLQNGAGLLLDSAKKEVASIQILKDSAQPKEGYILDISEKHIVIKASDAGGAFYGIQTLRQLLPASLEGINSMENQTFVLPQFTISDAPKFQYRGMHLDVGRHFFPKEFIKKYIASMALLKMNYFHWHLTEDQGWRIEILQYPNLTKHGAYREETLIGHYNNSPQQFDGKRYGGFYTQDDIKEIVVFAQKHNVTIIPEIEMPGHAQAAISAYPELGCTGKQISVATKWGVFENIYCPNEKTFTFLKNVVSEVIELFPGEYIHIGGDEAPKIQWEKCNHCQKLIKDLNLIDEHGLQSYFIKEMEAFLNSKGKKIIGWDEILEGGLAPNATVMSWRGMQGGIDAAKAHHNVIMTPTSHSYFDYYQSENKGEPLAIGGFLPLKKVYSLNPVPEELGQEEAKYVLGAQGNLWTEYMPTSEQVEYMAFPRMLAMSEVVWSGPSEEIEQDYPDFLSRLEPFLKRLDALNINYANHLYEIEGAVVKKNGGVYYKLSTLTEGKEIRYSVNTSEEKKYDSLIPITENAILKANLYKAGEKIGNRFLDTIQFHKGIKGTVSLNVEPNKAYAAGGKEALINGIMGSNSRYGDKEWLGFWGNDLEITIDFAEETEINKVTLRFYNAPGQWIYAPKEALLKVFLSDGRQPSILSKINAPEENKLVDVVLFLPDQLETNAKKFQLKIPNFGVIPDGLQGAGNKAWTFIDEIIIE
jgi:hexosaminidase